MIRRVVIGAVLIVSVGCGKAWTPTGPDGDPKGEFVLAETARFAQMLGVRVTGILTDEVYWTTCSDGTRCEAAGWYLSGKAYYWRPWVTREEATYSYLSALAAHEVCHSKHPDEAGANACGAELSGQAVNESTGGAR